MNLREKLKGLERFMCFSFWGLLISLVSSMVILCGCVENARVVFGRSPNPPYGYLLGSFFIHESWGHLLGNLITFIIATAVICFYTQKLQARGLKLKYLTSCLCWNFLVFLLMLSTSTIHLALLFSTGKYGVRTVGMSDLVHAVVVIAIGVLLAKWFACKAERLAVGRFSLLFEILAFAVLSLSLLLSNTRVAMSKRVEVGAHLSGVISGICASFFTIFLPSFNKSYVKNVAYFFPFYVLATIILAQALY